MVTDLQWQTLIHSMCKIEVCREYNRYLNKNIEQAKNCKNANSGDRPWEHTKSWYTRSRSFTTSSVSSALVISFDSHCGGGSSGGMYIRGSPFSPSISMEATLKFPPHWLHILLPRHFASKASSRSLRLITKSISVTPSSIS